MSVRRVTTPVGWIVQQRRNRQTGTTITVERCGPGSWVEQEPGWLTLCEEHSSCVVHPTRRLAERHASDPAGWCEPCRGLLNKEIA